MNNATESLGEARYVWLGIYVPAPEHPPRHPRVEKVFDSEKAANDWEMEREGPDRAMTRPYRRVERHEVVDA